MESSPQQVKEGKFFAVISYIGFLCIVSLVLKKDNHFAAYHAKQGLVLFVIEVVAFILSIIPFIGCVINVIVGTFCVLASIWGIVHSLQEKECRIPLVSQLAEKIIL